MSDLPPALPEVLAAHRLACTVESRKQMFSALCECGWEKTIHNTKATSLALHEQHRADMWREARTIRTVEQLDLLPSGSVVRDADGEAWQRDGSCEIGEAWFRAGGECDYPADRVPLPALVLWLPEAVTGG